MTTRRTASETSPDGDDLPLRPSSRPAIPVATASSPTSTPWIRQVFHRDPSSRPTLDGLVRAAPVGDPTLVEPTPTAEFLERLTQALLEYGLPVDRLEEAVERLSRALAVTVDFICTPTSLILAVGEDDRASIRVVRVEPGAADFARLSALYDLVGRIERREISPLDGSLRIKAILAQRSPYGGTVTLLAHGLVSLASAVLLGAGVNEVLAAIVLGLALGALSTGVASKPTVTRLMPFFASALASAVGYGLSRFSPDVSPLRLVLASVIMQLPGYATTVGMMELATGNIVSGSARIAGAMVRFLMLALGVAVGERVAAWLGMPLSVALAQGAEPVFRGFEYLSPAIAGVAFTVLQRARLRDTLWIVFVCYASTAGVFWGGRIFGPTLSSFAGAFVAAVLANVIGRFRDRPSTVLVTPAIFLLVPGGIGFMSLSSLLHRDMDTGVETALRMGLVAASIAAGLMMASIAAPPRRSL